MVFSLLLPRFSLRLFKVQIIYNMYNKHMRLTFSIYRGYFIIVLRQIQSRGRGVCLGQCFLRHRLARLFSLPLPILLIIDWRQTRGGQTVALHLEKRLLWWRRSGTKWAISPVMLWEARDYCFRGAIHKRSTSPINKVDTRASLIFFPFVSLIAIDDLSCVTTNKLVCVPCNRESYASFNIRYTRVYSYTLGIVFPKQLYAYIVTSDSIIDFFSCSSYTSLVVCFLQSSYRIVYTNA